jgi:MFS family permease
MWGIPAFIFLVAFFHRVAPGVVAKELMESFQATGTLIGLLSAAYFYIYAALMIPAGLLVDAFGPRRVVAVGGSVMGVGTLVMGAAISTGTLFVGRLLVGLGASVIFVGALKVAALWFPPRRFATLSGFTATMGMLGSLAATVPLAMVAGAVGWRWSFHLVGFLTLLASGLCWAIVRDHPPDLEVAASSQDVGQVLSGAWQVVRNPYTWPPFVTFFCFYSATANLMLWVVPYLRDVYDLSTRWASVYATAPSLALLISAPLTGYLSDHVLARRRLPYLALSWGFLGLWALFALTLGTLPLWGVYGLFFAMGLLGAAFVLTWPVGREVNPPRLAGLSVAVVNLGGFLGAALTQGAIGAVLDSRWTGATAGGARVYPLESYQAAFWVCSGFVFAAALLAFLIRETHCRNIYHELFPASPPFVDSSSDSR